MNQNQKNVTSWILLDAWGRTVTMVKRPNGKMPKGPTSGIWRQIKNNWCCDTSSYILFRNTTASANITAISTADKAINWSGTLANGAYYIFAIPRGYDETFSITVDTPTGRTITTSVAQQDVEATATIGAVGAITLATNTFATNIAQGAQFLVILS